MTDFVLPCLVLLSGPAIFLAALAVSFFCMERPHGGRSSLFSPKVWLFAVASLGAGLLVFLWWLAPVQGPVVLYKITLALLAGVLMYGLDRALFPYAAPSSYLVDDWRRVPDQDGGTEADYPIVEGYKSVFCLAMARQALLVGCGILAVCLGL